MEQFRIVLSLLFTLIVLVFSVQNAEIVEIKFLHWQMEISRALLMLFCVAIGSIFTILAMLPMYLRKTNNSRSSSEDSEIRKNLDEND